ncbi:hypothetical protein BGZ93_002398 [Podila epicladia]|nr:hypothetical protein BGZ93_002398 [Podila epicladia]
MMTDRRRQRNIKSEDKPVLDSTIYRRLTKKPKFSDDLPYRKLYNLEILNDAGTSYQSLENLQKKGPFQALGSVPIEDTIRSTGDRKERGRLINIRATSIVEWTHEFNPSNVMEPVIWLLSENVCWYQVQNMHPSYDPWIRPLANVCVYLDAIIHAHFTLKINDELNDLAPQLSELLNMSTSAVWDALREHQEQILRLCNNDKELKLLKFVQAWQNEASRPPSSRRSRSVQPNTRQSTPASSTSSSTSIITRPVPVVTPVPQECETTMARTKASIRLAQSRLKVPLSPPPHHPSELEPVTVNPEGDEYDKEYSKDKDSKDKDKDSKDDNKHYSSPDTFQCPVDTCLISVSNSLSPTTTDFAELILQHLCDHDLTASNMEHIRQYLATSQSSAAKLELKGKNSQKGMPSLLSQSTGKALNVHLYWELQAGNFQFKAGNPHMSTAGTTRQTALRTIPTQIRGGRRQPRTWSVQRPALSDLEPRTDAQRHQRTVSSSDAPHSTTAHEASLQRFPLDRAPSQASNNTEASGDTTTTDPLTFSIAVAAHQDVTSTSRKRSHSPMYAIEITDDDGDDEESNMTVTEDETIAAGFNRYRPNGRSVDPTRQHAQPQGSARMTALSSIYRDAKRDRSDSYDDDFMQPKHRMLDGNSRFGSAANTRAPVAAPAREFIEIHGSDSEEASSEKNDKYAPSQLGRKRQRTERYGTSMSPQQSGRRANSSSTLNTRHVTSTNPSRSDSSTNPGSNNSWFSWAKPARIAMSYISSPRTDHSGKRDV